MGKLVAAFVFFLAASALAIREAKPPAPTPQSVEDEVAAPSGAEPTTHLSPPPVETAPSRAIRDEVPPWVKYAAPPPPRQRVITVESSIIIFDDNESRDSDGDIPDISDKCPDQPNESDDYDGCPETGPKERVILID